MYFFLNTHRCLFNWVTHNSVITFCEFLRTIIASYTAKDKFSINTLFLNNTIQLTRLMYFCGPEGAQRCILSILTNKNVALIFLFRHNLPTENKG